MGEKLFNNMRLFYFLCVICLSTLFVTGGHAWAKEIYFSMQLDKTEYTKQDAIHVEFEVQNKGESLVWINKRFYLSSSEIPKKERDIYLKVMAPSGEELICKYKYGAGFPKTAYFVELGSEESVQSERPKNLKSYYDFSQEGVYTLTAYYENTFGPEIGLDAFRDKLVSKSIEIKIME
jgi:hypothetical protein